MKKIALILIIAMSFSFTGCDTVKDKLGELANGGFKGKDVIENEETEGKATVEAEKGGILSFLDKFTKGEEAVTETEAPTAEPTPTPTLEPTPEPTPTPTPEPTPTPTPYSAGTIMYVTENNVYVHEAPDVLSSVRKTVNCGETLIAYHMENGFYYVKLSGEITAYIASNYLSVEKPKNIEGTRMYLTGFDVRFRTEPNTSCTWSRLLPKGMEVTAYDKTGDFYYARLADGSTGYIMASYLSTSKPIIKGTPAYYFDYEIINGQVTVYGLNYQTERLEIPETIEGYPVRRISASAFAHETYLRTVVIPYTVLEIGNSAFEYCMINTIGFTGTQAQWNKVKIGVNNDAIYNANIIVNYNY